MNRSIASSLAMGTATILATLAATAITCASAYADDITNETRPFVSSLTRAEVIADLKTPYAGGNPWSAFYKNVPAKSVTTRDEATSTYKMSREEASALHAEDSGSAYFIKSARSLGAPAAAVMGAAPR